MGKGIVFSVDEEKFFSKCVKHQNLPKNDALKQILLKRIMQEFDAGRAYSEIESMILSRSTSRTTPP